MEERLLFYSELTPEERLEVDRHVQQHPEMMPLLEEAKAFTALIEQAQLLRAQPPGDEALAYFIATRHLGPQPLPAPLQEAFARIEAKLADDAALRERYAKLAQRMTALEAASDPVRQFEQLSGHRLPAALHEVSLRNGEDQTYTALPEARARSERRPVIHRLWTHAGRWAMAAVVFGVVLYGSLGLVSHFSQTDLDRLAVFDAEMIADGDFRVRGDEQVGDDDPADALYARALPLLREARTATLGLFPHYDPAMLQEAAGLLERVVAQEEEESTLAAEAHYLLAKIRLAQKNVDGAKAALQAILDGSGWMEPEARTLLDEIEALSN